jgi:hypothetical protein
MSDRLPCQERGLQSAAIPSRTPADSTNTPDRNVRLAAHGDSSFVKITR